MENETLRNHTGQIKQLKEKARLQYEEIVKEQRMKQEKEIGQLKETMRLENEEHEGQGVKEIKKERQKQLKKKARLKYAEIVKEQRMKQEKEIS